MTCGCERPLIGTTQVPSARRKLTVPPPDAGAQPVTALVNRSNNAVCAVAVAAVRTALPAAVPSLIAVAGMLIVVLAAAVTSPLALTVTAATCVAVPNAPTLLLTVARGW